MTPDPLQRLADRWRDEAEKFRSYGAEQLARSCEKHAEEMEDAFRRWWYAPLTVAEAAEWSGYSEDRIRSLARSDELPSSKKDGRIRIPRSALPRKPGRGGPTGPVGEPPDRDVPSREQMARAVVESS